MKLNELEFIMSSTNVKDILSAADELTGSSSDKRISVKGRSFLDETGRETFYVQNSGNTQLYFSKLKINIKRGELKDLLEEHDIETLSRDAELRKFLAAEDSLKRLTKEEFDHEKEVERDLDRRIASIKAEQDRRVSNNVQSKDAPQQSPVRPVVMNKVAMLVDFYNPDINISKYGMTPVEFVKWAKTEKFQSNEIDYVLTSVEDSEIRAFMFKRKKELYS